MACTPLAVDTDGGHFILPPPWEPLPNGVDNSLGQRVLVPLVDFAAKAGTPLDVDAILSERLDAGLFGQIVKIDGWNGEPDDDQVLAIFAGSDGTFGPDGGRTPPKWDGHDAWRPSGKLNSYPPFPGYVSGGELVVDTSSSILELIEVTLTDAHGNQQLFTIAGRRMVRVGHLTKDHLTLVSYGRWDLADALQQTDTVAAFLSGEPDPDAGNAVRNVLASDLPVLLTAAADLPLSREPTPGQPCTALSLALRAEAWPAVAGATGP